MLNRSIYIYIYIFQGKLLLSCFFYRIQINLDQSVQRRAYTWLWYIYFGPWSNGNCAQSHPALRGSGPSWPKWAVEGSNYPCQGLIRSIESTLHRHFHACHWNAARHCRCCARKTRRIWLKHTWVSLWPIMDVVGRRETRHDKYIVYYAWYAKKNKYQEDWSDQVGRQRKKKRPRSTNKFIREVVTK